MREEIENNGDSKMETEVGHVKKDDIDIYIGRGDGACAMGDVEIGERGWLGNPFPLDEMESETAEERREESITKFNVAMKARLKADEDFRLAVGDLSGKTLGCWCQTVAEDGPACHGEVIAFYADQIE